MKINKFINVKELLKGILIFILFCFSSLFQLIPITLFNIKRTTSNSIILSTFSNICLLIILIIIYRRELIKEFKLFKKNLLENLDTGIKYWLIGLLVMMISNIIITYILGLNQAQNEQAVQKMINKMPIMMLITAGFIAPITEEITFRKTFKNIFLNKYLFIILSGLVFGSMHVITSYSNPLELLYIIPYGSLGMAFAAMYYKTDTIYTSISMHMLHNTILTLVSIL